ncbi:hypothetical protein P4S72_00595 [Vibrio sp. PP-XX7]
MATYQIGEQWFITDQFMTDQFVTDQPVTDQLVTDRLVTDRCVTALPAPLPASPAPQIQLRCLPGGFSQLSVFCWTDMRWRTLGFVDSRKQGR